MLPRTRNEKILLAVLLIVLFVGGNILGWKRLAQKQAGLNLTRDALRADRAQAEYDLLKRDVWARRQAWVQAHEPSMSEEGDAKAQVLQTILKGAREHKLEILEQSLDHMQHGAAGASVHVKVKIKGSMADLCQWLADLQKPDQFYAITLFSLQVDQDEISMVCTLQVARYFKEAS